jgi:hypothetical protein
LVDGDGHAAITRTSIVTGGKGVESRASAARAGALLTRGRVLEDVWDFARYAVSNVVDQYVMYLRRKIDRPFRVEQLSTLCGTGYRLREQPIQQAGRPSGRERTACRWSFSWRRRSH